MFKNWEYRTTRSGRKRKTYRANRNANKKSKKAMVATFSSKNSTQGGVPTTLPIKLLYADTYTLNPGAAGIASVQIMNLSSIHDPDFTGVGHQPLGHDQLEPLYERYQVWKVDFEIEFGNTDLPGCGVGYRISDSSSSSTDPRLQLENGNGEWGLIGYSGSGHKTFRGTVWLNNVHGIGYKQYMSNDDYGAPFGSNPTEGGYLHIWCDGLGGDVNGCKTRVRLTYHVKLMGSQLTALS